MKEGKDQESIQSSTSPDPGYQWESKTHNRTSQTRAKSQKSGFHMKKGSNQQQTFSKMKQVKNQSKINTKLVDLQSQFVL